MHMLNVTELNHITFMYVLMVHMLDDTAPFTTVNYFNVISGIIVMPLLQ